MDVDDEVARLYWLSLGEFTAARNALARELREAGEREAAERVKALAKPSLSAWAVNHLARSERLQMRSLLTAGERLRKAQEELLRGGSANELQEAFERHREVVAALLESARESLRSAGHPATEATLERVRATLNAAAGSEEGSRLVEEGRLTDDLDPAGFGPLALATGAGAKASERPKSAPGAGRRTPAPAKGRREVTAARTKRIEDARRELDSLRAEVNERRSRARRATAEARRAARAAEAAKKAAEKEEKELEQLTKRLEAAKDAFERAHSA